MRVKRNHISVKNVIYFRLNYRIPAYHSNYLYTSVFPVIFCKFRKNMFLSRVATFFNVSFAYFIPKSPLKNVDQSTHGKASPYCLSCTIIAFPYRWRYLPCLVPVRLVPCPFCSRDCAMGQVASNHDLDLGWCVNMATEESTFQPSTPVIQKFASFCQRGAA